MTNSTVTAPTVTIAGAQGAAEAEILTPKALEFLGALASNFEAERQRLLAARVTRAETLRTGKLYDFLPETASVRQERVARRAHSGRSRGPSHRDYRPSRSQDGDQRAQFRRESIHGRF